MRQKKGKSIMAVLLCVSAIFGLGGCKKESEPEPITGGTTDHTDYNAPKVIESKEISEFHASFYLRNRWTAEDRRTFQFQVNIDDNGVLKASEEFSGVSFPADATLLTALQTVIDEQKLAAMNGVDKITAGLPPEYQACTLRVNYASGEMLKFTVNNDPEAEWAEAIYTVFAEWFSAKGDDSLFPPKETSQVTNIHMELQENGIWLRYGAVKVSEEKAIAGEKYLLEKRVFDSATQEAISNDTVLFPEDYYERITEILAQYNLVIQYDFSYFDHDAGYYGMGCMTPDDGEADSEDVALVLAITYESGKRIDIDTKKASEIEGMRALLTELLEYNDSLF